jgi:colicin import membrane protein/DNA topoisomerase 2-associated protein PAT1
LEVEARVMEARVMEARVMEARVMEAWVMEARVMEARVMEARVMEARVMEARVMEARVVQSRVVQSRVVQSRVVQSRMVQSRVVQSRVVQSRRDIGRPKPRAGVMRCGVCGRRPPHPLVANSPSIRIHSAVRGLPNLLPSLRTKPRSNLRENRHAGVGRCGACGRRPPHPCIDIAPAIRIHNAGHAFS